MDRIRLKQLDGAEIEVPNKYYYLTCHREENTDDAKLSQILDAMEELGEKTIYPVHPRNTKRALKVLSEKKYNNIILTEPIGYLESICLVNNAQKIVTDSGGLQREAFFAGKKCVTILDFVCWQETMVGNRNQLAKPDKKDILEKLSVEQTIELDYKPFGDGHSSEKIVSAIEKYK